MWKRGTKRDGPQNWGWGRGLQRPLDPHLKFGVNGPLGRTVIVPGRWHNGGAFVFCAGDCLFKSEPTPTSADACWELTGCDADHQDFSRCSTRGGSQQMYITFASTKANKAEPTMALKPRGTITRNPKQGYQWSQNRTCIYCKLLKCGYLTKTVKS